jgi:hypothetical protein
MRIAAGLGPGMGKEDIWFGLAVGVIGLMMTTFEILSRNSSLQFEAAGALAKLSITAVAAYFVYKYLKSPARTVARDREWKSGFQFSALIVLESVLFNVWLQAAGVKENQAFAGMLLLLGACLVPVALTNRWRLSYVGWALPLMVYGFVAPWMSSETWHTFFGLCLFFGAVLSSGILALQLRDVPNEEKR